MLRGFASQRPLGCLYHSSRYAYASSSATSRVVQESSILPRYLRRESASQQATSSQSKEQQGSSSQKTYRSRHYDPLQEKSDASNMGIRLLQPHTLSSRLKRLCEANKIDEAVSMLKNSPRDAQNTQVWNTLIWECLKAKRFNLSYQLYTDMKRRGFSPSVRTFQTMFTGLSKIDNWVMHTKQLSNAHAIYDAFQRYMNSVKKHDPTSSELSSSPLSSYIKILGDNNLYQDIFDVYYALPSEGPMAPDKLVYTAMFHALALTSNAQPPTAMNIHNAANAKLLWTQMIKASQKHVSPIADTYVVTSAIAALSQGQIAEIDLAFQIVRDYFGLGAPDDPPSKGSLPLSQQSLGVILRLCNRSSRHALCAHFFQEVKSRPHACGGVQILDHKHLNEVLTARIALPEPGAAYYCVGILEWMLLQEVRNGSKITPNPTSYNLVLSACRRDGDWTSAAKVLHLMTGLHQHSFMDGMSSRSPRIIARQGSSLTAETFNYLVETSLASRDRASVRQCLRMISYLQVGRLFDATDSNYTGGKTKPSTLKLASAIVEAVRYISSITNKSQVVEEVKNWRQLSDAAMRYLRNSRRSASEFE